MLILRQRNILQWAGEHAFCQNWTLHVPAFLSASMSVWLVKTQLRAKGDGQVWHRFLCKWREALPLPLKRLFSPSDICPKQFWDFSRKFPENFRNISNIFRYFVRPIFIGFRDPPKFSRYFFEHFSLLSERFSEHFEHFPLHFRHFPWHLRPRSRYTFGPWRYNSWKLLELSMLQSHNLSSLSAEPSINVLWDHPKTSDCSMASQTPIKSEDPISDIFNNNV